MEFPNLGEHCSESTCNRLDFLPLKCDACQAIFCTDHITYSSHSCPSAHKKDVQVPVCPLCDTPIPMKRGDLPDVAVGSHIDNDCRENRRKVFSNKCSSKGCKVKEMVPVKCGECGANFCLKHRHPTDHACIGAEEALRLRRLEALKKKGTRATISQNSSNGNSHPFRSLQGTMTEDEALARALQASLDDEERSRRMLQPVPSGNRDRSSAKPCAIDVSRLAVRANGQIHRGHIRYLPFDLWSSFFNEKLMDENYHESVVRLINIQCYTNNES